MGQPFELQANYAGMVTDSPRDQLPAGAVWNMVDWVPQRIAAPLQKRGGFGWASPTLTGSTPSYLLGLCRTPDYGAGAFNVAVTDDGELYTFTDGGMTDEGEAVVVAQNPFVHRAGVDWVVVIPAADGSTGPLQWTDTGNEPEPLSDSAPAGKFGAVWNDRALLANGTSDSIVYPGRLWFGPVGDATGVWDPDSWWDFNLPVVAVGVTRNAILCFHARTYSRLRGSTPPRTPLSADDTDAVGDLIEDTPAAGESAVGCIDARSLTHWGEWLIWADFTGVYMTDGVSLESLTAKGGMSSYWKGLLPNFDGGWIISAGVERDVLMVSLVDGDQNPVDFLCYDLLRNVWYRFGANVDATCFMHIPGATADKTYAGRGSEPRVMDLETVLLAQNASDADGTPIEPVLETGFFRGFTRMHRRWVPSLSLQQWLRVYFNYEMDSDEGSTPTLAVSYATDALDPNNTTYTPLTRLLTASTLTSRVRMPLRFRSRGVAFKIVQSGASLDTMLRAIEAEYYPLEDGRVDTSGQTAPITVPEAPTLTGASFADGTVTLTWDAPDFDGGSAVTGYRVYRGLAAGAETFLDETGDVLTTGDDTVASDLTYFYKVAAVNAVGRSERSNELSVSTAPPVIGKVMQSNAVADDAWAEIDLGADRAEVWVTLMLKMDAASLAFWASGASPYLLALLPEGGLSVVDGVQIFTGPTWTTNWTGSGGTPVGDTWTLLEMHHVTGDTSALYVDGALLLNGTNAASDDTRLVRVGQFASAPNDPSLAYAAYVKVGTTRGGDDLFSDDFESGNLDAFTDTSGDVTVIDDP